MFSICFSFNLPESIYFMRQKINDPQILTAQFESQNRKKHGTVTKYQSIHPVLFIVSASYFFLIKYNNKGIFGQLRKYHSAAPTIQNKHLAFLSSCTYSNISHRVFHVFCSFFFLSSSDAQTVFIIIRIFCLSTL